jgi:hypothetical protein
MIHSLNIEVSINDLIFTLQKTITYENEVMNGLNRCSEWTLRVASKLKNLFCSNPCFFKCSFQKQMYFSFLQNKVEKQDYEKKILELNQVHANAFICVSTFCIYCVTVCVL